MISKLEKINERFKELSQLIVSSDVIADNKLYTKYVKEYSAIQPIAEKYEEYVKVSKDLKESEDLLALEEEPEMRSMINENIMECKNKLSNLDEEIKILLLPKDDNDEKNIIMEIRGGAGGDEATLFASELMRMYMRYAERHHWKVEILSLNETEVGGVKEASFVIKGKGVYSRLKYESGVHRVQRVPETEVGGVKEASFVIKGKGVYSRLKYESGVHRVQRVPETEASGRIHTSTATVAVLPEHEEVDIEIDEKDLRIDVFRSSGAGGQHVNKTESAIRITHIPTGIVVECQDERSQLKNKERAFSILKSKLYDFYQMQKDEEYARNRRNQVGTGDRSERIRTYNYPQGRLTDHRINYTVYNLLAFLDGDLDDLIDNLKIADQKAKLENSEIDD